MFKFIGLLLTSALVWAEPNFEPFIVGGQPAAEGTFPFVASIRFPSGKLSCGGSIVSEKFILTAGQCASLGAKKLQVGVGSVRLDKQKLMAIKKIIKHPDWTGIAYNDIALMELEEPLTFTDTVKPIKYSYSDALDQKNVTAVGWGYATHGGPISKNLMYIERPIMPNTECGKRLAPTKIKIQEGHICLSGKRKMGICLGDAGSPVVYQDNDEWHAVGVISWGIPCGLGYPDVCSRTSHYADWITSTIQA